MGIGLAGIGAFADADRLDAVGNSGARHIGQVGEEALEPEFQIQTVPQDEVGILGLDDVARGRLVIVNFRAGLGDGNHFGGFTCDVTHHVGNDGEGGGDLESFCCMAGHGSSEIKQDSSKQRGVRQNPRSYAFHPFGGTRLETRHQLELSYGLSSRAAELVFLKIMQMQIVCNKGWSFTSAGNVRRQDDLHLQLLRNWKLPSVFAKGAGQGVLGVLSYPSEPV